MFHVSEAKRERALLGTVVFLLSSVNPAWADHCGCNGCSANSSRPDASTAPSPAYETDAAKIEAQIALGKKPYLPKGRSQITGGVCLVGGKTVASLLLQNSGSAGNAGISVVTREDKPAAIYWDKSMGINRALVQAENESRYSDRPYRKGSSDFYEDGVAVYGKAAKLNAKVVVAPAPIDEYEERGTDQRRFRRILKAIEEKAEDLEYAASEGWGNMTALSRNLTRKNDRSAVYFGADFGPEDANGEPEVRGSVRYEVSRAGGKLSVKVIHKKGTAVTTDLCQYPEIDHDEMNYQMRKLRNKPVRSPYDQKRNRHVPVYERNFDRNFENEADGEGPGFPV